MGFLLHYILQFILKISWHSAKNKDKKKIGDYLNVKQIAKIPSGSEEKR